MGSNVRMQNMEQAYHRVKKQRDSLRQEVQALQKRIEWLESAFPLDSEYIQFQNAQEYSDFIAHYLSPEG